MTSFDSIMMNKETKILITGVAGFIGSNLLEFFLNRGFYVRGIDNFSTGFKENLDDVVSNIPGENVNKKFDFIERDITNQSFRIIKH